MKNRQIHNSFLPLLAATAAIFTAGTFQLSAAAIPWAGGNSTVWSDDVNWTGGFAPANDTTTDVATFNLPAYGGNPVFNPTITGDRSVAGVDILGPNAAMTLSGGNLTVGTGDILVKSGNATVISANLSGDATTDIIKTGVGTLTLSGTNTYGGVLNINSASTVVANSAQALSAGKNITSGSNGATLRFDVSPGSTLGNFTNTGGNIIFNISGNATGLATFGTWSHNNNANTLNATYSGGLSFANIDIPGGSRNYTKTGDGFVEIRGAITGQGANTNRPYTFTLSDGALALGANDSLGVVTSSAANVTLILNGGTLASNSASARDYSASVITGLGGNVTFGFTAATAVGKFANASAFTGAQTLGAVSINGNATRTVTINQNTTYKSFTSTAGTGGTIVKNGNATLTFSGPGFVTTGAAIEVNVGTLLVNGGGNSGAVLASSGNNTGFFVPLSSTAGIVVGQPVTGTGVPAGTVVAQVYPTGIKLSGTTAPANGAIVSGTSLTFASSAGGTGTLGVNVNNGGVFGGTGLIAPSGSRGISVANGGIFAPGASIGNFTVNLGSTTGIVNMQSGAQFQFELGDSGTSMSFVGPSDVLLLTLASAGDVAYNNTVIDFKNTGTYTGEIGWYKLFDTDFDATTWTGLTFDSISGKVSGGIYATNLANGLPTFYVGTVENGGDIGDIYLAIPEPSTWALMALSLTTLLVLRRRRTQV